MLFLFQETHLWIEEAADEVRTRGVRETERLEKRMQRLEAILWRRKMEKAQAIAREKAKEIKEKMEKIPVTPPST